MSHNHIRASKIPDAVDRSKNSNNALKPPHKKIQSTDVKKNGKINASEQLQWNQYDLHGHCLIVHILISVLNCEKQQSRGVLRKKCSKNMQHIHKSNFIEIALRHGYSPVNLLYIFRTTFSKNTSGWLLLNCDSASLSLSDWSFSPQTFWAKEERLSVPWKTVLFLFLSSVMFEQYR